MIPFLKGSIKCFTALSKYSRGLQPFAPSCLLTWSFSSTTPWERTRSADVQVFGDAGLAPEGCQLTIRPPDSTAHSQGGRMKRRKRTPPVECGDITVLLLPEVDGSRQ